MTVVDRKADPASGAEEAVTTKKNWPAWRYGPDGQSQIFENEDNVPEGWEDHPSKVGAASTGAGGGGKVPEDSPYKDESDARILELLKERKLDFNEKWPRAKLEGVLLTADKKAK